MFAEGRATEKLVVRLTETQRRDLDQMARDTRVKRSRVIREAINSYVADYREAREGRVFPLRRQTRGVRCT